MAGTQQNGVTRQIKGDIYNSLRNALVSPQGKSKKSWTDSFIQEMLKSAKQNPSGPLGQLLARQLLQDDILSDLDAQTEKLLARDQDFLHYRLIKQLYDKQREVAYDKFISRKIIATSRRAGKTNLAARLLVDYCIEPGTPCLYIHTKAENCMTQCWPLIIEAAKDIELGIEKADSQAMIVTFTNGSYIKLYGNKDKSSAPLLRGGKYKIIIIDEAQDQRNMVELVEDVCEPMLIDFKNSCMILQGTPPRRPKTYFEGIWKKGKWKQYHFTMNDNPFLPEDTEEYIKALAERKNIQIDDPLILREYRGEFVYDVNAQVFRDYKTYDKEKDNPNNGLHIDEIVIGNDYGWAAYNSIIGVAIDNTKHKGYVYFESKFNKADVSKIIAVNKNAVEEGKKILIQNGSDPGEVKIFGDTSDTAILEEMKRVHDLPAYQAWKYNKEEAITQLAEHCRTGAILIPNDGVLDDEFKQILYERDEEDNITPIIDDDKFHPDAMFALLYASRHWCYKWGLKSGAKEVKEITNAKEFVQQYETFEDNRTPTGIMELGDAEAARHFIR